MRVIGWIVGVPLAVLVLLFAVANRGPVTMSLDPFNTAAPTAFIEMPLFLLLFATLFAGVLLGGFATWVSGGARRREGRRVRDEARLYRQEAERLRADQAAQAEPVGMTTVFAGGLASRDAGRQIAAPSGF